MRSSKPKTKNFLFNRFLLLLPSLLITAFFVYQYWQSQLKLANLHHEISTELVDKDPSRSIVHGLAALDTKSSWILKLGTLGGVIDRTLGDTNNVTPAILDLPLRRLKTSALAGHERWITGIGTNSKANWVISGGREGQVRFWDVHGKSIAAPVYAHPGGTRAVAMDIDAQLAVSGGRDGRIYVWSPDGSKIKEPWQAHEGWINALAVIAEEDLIVSGGNDGQIRIWSIHNDSKEPITFNVGSIIRDLAITRNSEIIISGDIDGKIQVWNRSNKSLVFSFHTHGGRINAIATSDDGSIIYSAGDTGKIYLWYPDGNKIGVLEGHDGSVRSLAFDDSGDLLISGGSDGIISVWRVSDMKLIRTFDVRAGWVNKVAFTDIDSKILSGHWDGTLRYWALEPKTTEMPLPFLGHVDFVSALDVGQDQEIIASASWDTTIRLWNQQGEPLSQPIQVGAKVTAVSMPANSDFIISIDENGYARRWHLASDRAWDGPDSFVLFQSDNKLSALTMSLYGHLVAIGDINGVLHIVDSEGKPISEPFKAGKSAITALSFNEKSQVLATGSNKGNIRMWDISGKPLTEEIAAHSSKVTSIVSDSGSNLWISSGTDGNLRFWNEEGELVNEIKAAHNGEGILSIDYDPHSNLLATAGADETIRLWDFDGLQAAMPFYGHIGKVLAVKFLGKNLGLVSAGEDNTVRVWPLSLEADSSTLNQSCDHVIGYIEAIYTVNDTAKSAFLMCKKVLQ